MLREEKHENFFLQQVANEDEDAGFVNYMKQWLNQQRLNNEDTSLKFSINSTNIFTESLFVKINIFYLVAAFILMAFYTFLVSIHYKYINIEKEKLLNKSSTNEKGKVFCFVW